MAWIAAPPRRNPGVIFWARIFDRRGDVPFLWQPGPVPQRPGTRGRRWDDTVSRPCGGAVTGDREYDQLSTR